MNLTRLMHAAQDGVTTGPTNRNELAAASAIPKSTVYRILDAGDDLATGIDKLAQLAGTFGRPAWHLLLDDLRPEGHPRPMTDEAVEAEVQRRLHSLLNEASRLQVSDEKARAGPSVAYPFGPVQDARPEPPPTKRARAPKTR